MKLYVIFPFVLQKIIWIPTRLMLMFFCHVDIRGLEHLKKLNTNAIFASNHTSELDPFFVPSTLPMWTRFAPVFYVSREESFYENSGWRRHFYGGTFFKAWGAYPLFAGLRDYEKSLYHHIRIVNEGGTICFFPEGRITRDGTIQEGKGGVAYLAQATGKPIVPVHYGGAWRMSVWDFLLRRRHITVTYGEPLYIRDAADDFKSYANLIMRRIADLDPRRVSAPVHVPNKEQVPVAV